jgi:hypothetical protein
MRRSARNLKIRRSADDIPDMTHDAARPSLGNLLVERGVITPEQLDSALAIQRSEGGMLGEILTTRGWVSPLSIAAAVAKQKTDPEDAPAGEARQSSRGATWKPLGTLLVEKGFITEVELKQALAVQGDGGGFLGEILVERGWLSAADLVMALAAQLGIDFDMKRAAKHGGATAMMPADRAAAHFDVLEDVDGEVQSLKTAETFMEATDFVFDEVLWQREPGSLQIVRVDATLREVVWSFRPGESIPAANTGDDLLSVFGYSVGKWEDKYTNPGDGSPVAAAG